MSAAWNESRSRVSDAVALDKEEVAEVIQLTPHEIQKIKKRRIVDITVPPDKEDIAKIRQLVTPSKCFRARSYQTSSRTFRTQSY